MACNMAFESRVREVLMLELRHGSIPADVRARHGAIVMREAAHRKPLLLTRTGRWCPSCGGWYVRYEGRDECPACHVHPNEPEGSAWAPVARSGRRGAVVHAMALERWVRYGMNAYERRPGQVLCRQDDRIDVATLEPTTREVTCMHCMAKLRTHLRDAAGQGGAA